VEPAKIKTGVWKKIFRKNFAKMLENIKKTYFITLFGRLEGVEAPPPHMYDHNTGLYF